MAASGYGAFESTAEAYDHFAERVHAVASRPFKPFDEPQMQQRRSDLETIFAEEVEVAAADLACQSSPEQSQRAEIEFEFFAAVDEGLAAVYVSAPGS